MSGAHVQMQRQHLHLQAVGLRRRRRLPVGGGWEAWRVSEHRRWWRCWIDCNFCHYNKILKYKKKMDINIFNFNPLVNIDYLENLVSFVWMQRRWLARRTSSHVTTAPSASTTCGSVMGNWTATTDRTRRTAVGFVASLSARLIDFF